MKNLTHKRFFAPVILLLIYLLLALLGTLAIMAEPVFFQQRRILLPAVRLIAQDHFEQSGDISIYTQGANFAFYDAEGNRIAENPRNSAIDPPGMADRYAHMVLSGKEVFRVLFTTEHNDLFVIAGAPAERNGRITGAVFLMRNLKNVPEAVEGYLVVCTAVYWPTACLYVSNVRRKRRLEELQRNYIANITHAFKTPIASIRALTETLYDEVEPDPNRQKLYYGMILQETGRQDRMVRDILELARLQSHTMDFPETTVSAAEIIGPVREKYSVLCDCMDISLEISDEIAALPALYTNAAHIRQIFEILLDNALKYVREGGEIRISASAGRNYVTFSVQDNGIGISAEDLPHVFERFFKCSHNFSDSGNGLGLAIAKELISGLKGKIWAESTLGEGSAFFFTVRLK